MPVAQANQQREYATQARNAIEQQKIDSRMRELQLRMQTSKELLDTKTASAAEKQAADLAFKEAELEFKQEKLKTDWFERNRIAETNVAAKQKAAELLAQSKPDEGDKQAVQTLATREANAIVGSSELGGLIERMKDPSTDLSTKRFAAQTSFKTINSALWGSDAVSKEEAERIGAYLNITGFGEWIRSGKLPPPNPEMFIKAIEAKKKDLDETILKVRKQREAMSNKQSTPAAGGSHLSKPASVPDANWNNATPAQKQAMIQAFK